MGDVIELDDGGRIDVASQKILIRLRKGGWVYTGDLREVTELEQNSQVLYRLEEHLIPAGFVHEASRDRENEFRRFQLTSQGQLWVDDHEEELSYPASRAETQEMAYRAVQEAESAKSSVQSYRKKLHRMKNRVEDDMEEIGSDVNLQGARLSDVSRQTQETKQEVDRLSRSISDVEKSVEKLQRQQEEDVERFELWIADQGGDLREEIEQLREENDELRNELEEVREQVIVHRLQIAIRRLSDFFARLARKLEGFLGRYRT